MTKKGSQQVPVQKTTSNLPAEVLAAVQRLATIQRPESGGLLSMAAGPLLDEIPIFPGGCDSFVDASLPASIRRAEPADPAAHQAAVEAAQTAADELGITGRIGLQWFVCDTRNAPTRILDNRLGIGAHFYLFAFATATQTDPPSVWLRLDGRQISADDLTHLVRHEVAHLRLEGGGMASGPIQEAMAETFAGGGMPALAGAFGAQRSIEGPSGLALCAGNGNGTVIIDGTSNMFKIAAEGTISTTNVGGTPANATASVSLSTGFTYIPALVLYSQWNDGTYNVDEVCPNGVYSAAGALCFLYEGWTSVISTNHTRVLVHTFATTAGLGGTVAQYKYFVLKEAAL
jgi:hypothetical protein